MTAKRCLCLFSEIWAVIRRKQVEAKTLKRAQVKLALLTTKKNYGFAKLQNYIFSEISA